MKAERRHELKQNSLVRNLQQIPTAGKQYQSQIMLGVVLVALVGGLVWYRINSARDKLQAAMENLSTASDDLKHLTMIVPQQGSRAPLVMQEREGLYAEGIRQADEALDKAPAGEVALRAQALLDKGDLNFEMANFPELAGAATQPSLRPAEPTEDLLSGAQAAYEEVLRDYPGQIQAVTAAHFGLAAVAEDRAAANGNAPADWDVAKQQYQAVLDGSAPPMFKALASDRLRLLAEYEHPAAVNVIPPNIASFPGATTEPIGPQFTPPAQPSPATHPTTARATTR